MLQFDPELKGVEENVVERLGSTERSKVGGGRELTAAWPWRRSAGHGEGGKRGEKLLGGARRREKEARVGEALRVALSASGSRGMLASEGIRARTAVAPWPPLPLSGGGRKASLYQLGLSAQ